MHLLNDIVIPHIAAEWRDVAYALEFESSVVKRIERNHSKDVRECCRELFEDWLATSNGKKPKIWKTLITTLNELKDLVSVTQEIIDKLTKIDSTL